MAATTTAVNACDVVVKLDNVASALTDISGSSNNVKIEWTNATGSQTVFGSDYDITLCCKTSVAITLEVLYTELHTEAKTILTDWQFNKHCAQKTISIYVPDDSAGSDIYTCEVIMEKLSLPLSSNDAAPILVSATLKNAGAMTCTTVAS